MATRSSSTPLAKLAREVNIAKTERALKSKAAGLPAASAGKTAAAAMPSSEKVDEPYEYPAGFKKPKSLAAGADLLFVTRTLRLAKAAEADKLEVTEKAIKHWLLENLPAQSASGISGKLCRVSISKKDVPRAANWPEIYSYMVTEYNKHKKKNDGQHDGVFSLLGRKLGEKAVAELAASGVKVPGVESFTITSLSVSKL